MLSSAAHSLPPLATSSRKTLTCPSHQPLVETRCCPCGRRHLLSASAAAAAALLPILPSKAATDLTDGVERFHPSRPEWYEEVYANAMEQGMRDYEDEIAGYKLELFNHLSRESKNVIELGVGTGPNFKYYANVAGLNVFGVDPNKQMEKYARAAAVAAGLAPKQFTFLRGVGEALPVRDNSMDVVVGTLVLCSVKDVNMALMEVKRVLKPGGLYLFIEHVAARGTPTNHLCVRVLEKISSMNVVVLDEFPVQIDLSSDSSRMYLIHCSKLLLMVVISQGKPARRYLELVSQA